jgi:ABC transporter
VAAGAVDGGVRDCVHARGIRARASRPHVKLHEIENARPRRRSGAASPRCASFFGLSVAEHFKLGHRGERLDVKNAYEYFPQLRGLKDRRAGLLSGGEQQMLALARALAARSKLLLVDELSLGWRRCGPCPPPGRARPADGGPRSGRDRLGAACRARRATWQDPARRRRP